jgi:hypothetical protein
MPRTRFILLALMSLLRGTLAAQKTPDKPPIDITPPADLRPPSKGDPFSGSLFGHWGVPVGAFHRNEDGGGGVGAHGAYALGRSRVFSLRVDGGFLAYGYVSRNRRVPQYDNLTGDFIGYEDVSYAVRQHQMYYFDVGPELTALSGRWRPYTFATAGLSYFVSTMNVRPPSYSDDEGDDRTIFSAGNFAWSTGLGMRFGSRAPRQGLFDFGVRFRRNERARYANDKALSTTSNGAVTVTPFHGSANLLTIYAGIWIGPVRLQGR